MKKFLLTLPRQKNGEDTEIAYQYQPARLNRLNAMVLLLPYRLSGPLRDQLWRLIDDLDGVTSVYWEDRYTLGVEFAAHIVPTAGDIVAQLREVVDGVVFVNKPY